MRKIKKLFNKQENELAKLYKETQRIGQKALADLDDYIQSISKIRERLINVQKTLAQDGNVQRALSTSQSYITDYLDGKAGQKVINDLRIQELATCNQDSGIKLLD